MTLPAHAAGSTWCECSVCGQGFGGVTLFDKHRVGDHGVRDGTANRRRCLTAREMAAKGWHQDGKGLWKDEARATMPFAAVTGGANRGVAAKTQETTPSPAAAAE